MIECGKLRKVYAAGTAREVVAVRDVSFQVRPGEVFGLLGANGAGKTTTLRMIATIIAPTSGDCVVDGISVTADGEAARMKMGYLSGETRLYDRLTPREIVGHFGEFFDVPREEIRRRGERLFEMLAMSAYADRPCGELSKGMKQMVSIARALVHDPPALVFDEPTASLDIFAARRVLDVTRGFADAGKAVILSTHIMSEVERICDRAAIIHRGTILVDGTVGEILAASGRADFEDAFFALVEAHDAQVA
jgi:sodium transport system ATP-binding protein